MFLYKPLRLSELLLYYYIADSQPFLFIVCFLFSTVNKRFGVTGK
jgi:hypothetical protein